MATGSVEMTSMLRRAGSVGAVDGVADGEGEHAADERGDQADLHGVPDRAQRQRIGEQPLEVHQAVLALVEQAGQIVRMNRNLRKAATVSASVGSTTTTNR